MKLLMLGGLKLESTTLTRPKPLLLLAYLSLEGSRSRRDMADLFWGSSKDPMQSLRLALVQLNKEANGAVHSEEGKLWTEVQSDVAELQRALTENAYSRAVELYKGPFLEGFDVSEIGEELEEWLYRTREDLAAQIREAKITLGERKAWRGHYDKAAKWAEAAYLTRSAPEPSPETLQRLYILLQAGNNVHASSVAKEASTYGLQIVKTMQEARLELEARNLQSQQSLEPVVSHGEQEDREVIHLSIPVAKGVPAFTPPPENLQKRKQKFAWFTVPLGLIAGLSVLLLLDGYRFGLVASGAYPTTSASMFRSSDGSDDVDVGLQSGYFCDTANNLYLSSSYDNQSTALRFPETGLPQSTPETTVVVTKALLIFTASNDLHSIPAGAGFTVKGIFDGSPWIKNENCDIPGAQNYLDRTRTTTLVTYQPTEWNAGESYEIDVKAIVQEIVDNAEWSGNDLAFAVDKLPASMVDLKAYSIEGAEAATSPVQPPTLRLEYTLNSNPN
jgi:hypothetical protein